jgi:hypothetical protein
VVRGELVSKAEQIAVFEAAGRTLSRAIQTLSSWAEELAGVARTGDVPAITQWLRAKSADFCNLLADLIFDQAKELANAVDDKAGGGDTAA